MQVYFTVNVERKFGDFSWCPLNMVSLHAVYTIFSLLGMDHYFFEGGVNIAQFPKR